MSQRRYGNTTRHEGAPPTQDDGRWLLPPPEAHPASFKPCTASLSQRHLLIYLYTAAAVRCVGRADKSAQPQLKQQRRLLPCHAAPRRASGLACLRSRRAPAAQRHSKRECRPAGWRLHTCAAACCCCSDRVRARPKDRSRGVRATGWRPAVPPPPPQAKKRKHTSSTRPGLPKVGWLLPAA